MQNTVFRNYLKRFEEKYGSDNQRDETQLIQMIDSGLNNDIDRGDDADESELENTFSNNYQCNDEDSDWERWEEEDVMSSDESNEELEP